MKSRLELRLTKEEKKKITQIANYFGFSISELIRKWIRFDGPENLMREWNAKFTSYRGKAQ